MLTLRLPVCETGFALAAFLALFLNLILPEEIEDEETPELTADTADERNDREEWARINKLEGSERGKEKRIDA